MPSLSRKKAENAGRHLGIKMYWTPNEKEKQLKEGRKGSPEKGRNEERTNE